MSRIENEQIHYASLLVHKFPLKTPCRVAVAQALYQEYGTYDKINQVEERLRWCRMKQGLRQVDVANLIGVTKQVYQDWELGVVKCIPKEFIDKLAEIFEIPEDDLMDEYVKFIYDGQGIQLRNLRQKLGVNKRQYAKLLGVNESNYRKWEKEAIIISRKTWERYFKNV